MSRVSRSLEDDPFFTYETEPRFGLGLFPSEADPTPSDDRRPWKMTQAVETVERKEKKRDDHSTVDHLKMSKYVSPKEFKMVTIKAPPPEIERSGERLVSIYTTENKSAKKNKPGAKENNSKKKKQRTRSLEHQGNDNGNRGIG